MDDLLVWGEGTVEHDVNLKKVLQRAREVDLKLCPKKCKFRLDQVSYVGHQFTKGGLNPDEAKVTAIKEMPSPDSPEAVRRFLDWNGLQYLILVDSYSGWFEMDTLSDLSAKTVIKKMKRHFAVHGIPCRLLTGNGQQFASREFERFASEWSFTSSPHFPQSKGVVENSVKQAKNLLDKCKDGSDPLLGLLDLRNVPRDQTLSSPAQRLMSRRTRCILPVAKKLLTPKALSSGNVSSRRKLKRQQQKAYYDQHAKPLSPLPDPQQVVRLQTDKGYEKVGII